MYEKWLSLNEFGELVRLLACLGFYSPFGLVAATKMQKQDFDDEIANTFVTKFLSFSPSKRLSQRFDRRL